MHRRRAVVAASVLTVLACAWGTFAFVSAQHENENPSEVPPGVPDNVEVAVPLQEVSNAGLREAGALDPLSSEIELADPATLDYPLVALTDPLDLDPSIPYVIGVTWEGSGSIAIDARCMTDGQWQPWERVDRDGGEPGEGDLEVLGTEPYIAVNSTAVQFRASSDTDVPPALTVRVFSSELVPASETTPGAATSPSTAYDAASVVSAVTPVDNPQPVIHLRDEWSPRDPSGEFDIGTVQGAVVHHTAGTNSYSTADVPAILRGIQNYHMDARGWFDIGYNFLVDKYGRIWEGRAGGIENTIWGVHSHSYNGVATGVSLMGNYDLVQPPVIAVNALADLIAWKLTLHGVSVSGNVYSYVSGYLPALTTHRNIPEASTSCPGQYLYTKIPYLRTAVAARQNLPSLELNVDATGDGLGDVARLEDGVVSVYTPGTIWAVEDATHLPELDLSFDALTEGPALDDGAGTDVIAQETTTGRLYRLPSGTHAQQISTVPLSGDPGSTVVLLPGDVTGDGHRDLVTVDMTTGNLQIRAGDGSGGVAAPVAVSSGWGVVATVTAPGDVTGDGNPDLVAILAGGSLRVAHGNGTGGFTLGGALSGDWSDFRHLVGIADLTGDGIRDLLAWSFTTGETRTVMGGATGPTGAFLTWADPQPTRPLAFGSVDWASEPGSSLVALNPRSEYWAYSGLPYAKATLWPTGLTLNAPTAVSTTIVGDVDGNGLADVITVDSSGRLWLHLSEGTEFGDPIEIQNPDDEFTNWAGYSSVTGAGDVNFDGWPDLVAVEADGDVVVFPWSTTDPSELQFYRVVARGYIGYEVFGTGSWGPNRVSDLMAIGPTGDVVLLRGSGLTGATLIGTISTGWDASTEFWALGISEEGEAAGVVVYTPASGTFEYFTWSTTGEWTLDS
ncbi:MAG: VCBS repeat-containing protein [Demequinaceae bacterium]|nr:VCBS repeat-containing protein [Demequinaceae bacterium]